MVENLVTNLITYGEDSLKLDSKREVVELQEQFECNMKFKKVLHLVFELFELFMIKPSFMERMNFLVGFREFVIDKYIQWRTRGPKLIQLSGLRSEQEQEKNVEKEKKIWVELVRLYNALSLKVDSFQILLQRTTSFSDNFEQIRTSFKEDYLVEVIKISSRFLFCQKMFKECYMLLSKVVDGREKPWPAAYDTFQKLKEACQKVSSDNQIIPEVEDIRNTKPMKTTKKKPFDTEEVVLDAEEKVLTQSDISEKMAQFEKMQPQEQINQADTYLLAYLQNQRNEY